MYPEQALWKHHSCPIVLRADGSEESRPSLASLLREQTAQGTGMIPILDLSPMAFVKSERSRVVINSWLVCLLLFSLSVYQEIVAETMKRRERREWEARR